MTQPKQSFKLIGFFVLYTFSITWLCWAVIIVGNIYFNALWNGEPLWWVFYTLGSWGPAISSYLVYRQFNADFSGKSFAQFIFGKKIALKVWLIFGLYFVWRFLMIWVAFEIKKPIPVLSMLINFPFLILLGGLEELGWRGVLQPRLEKVVDYLPSVLIVGVIWGVWHLPLWLIKGSVQSAFPFGLYLFSGIVLTASLTTLYKYTNNIFLSVLSHAWFNGCIGLALVGSNGTLHLNVNGKVIVAFLVELIVSVVLGIRLTRKT